MKVELYNYTKDPIATIAYAAKDCYDSKPKTKLEQRAIVEHCIKSGHHSVLEYAWFHFRVIGVSRAYTHQQVRKRIGASYAQRSQRWIKEDNFNYVIPESIRNNSKALEVYNTTMHNIQEAYTKLTTLGIPNEDARFVLSNGTSSIINVGMNFRGLIDFSNERLCKKAQWEIRDVARLMADRVKLVSPILSKYLVPKCVRLTRCPEKKSCGYIQTIKNNPYIW